MSEYINALMERQNSSAYWTLIGMRVVRATPGNAALTLPFKKDLSIAGGPVHGGAIASLADSAMAVAVMSNISPGDKVLAIELKINYISAFTEGELHAEGRLVHAGSRIAVAEGTLTTKDGKLVARCLGTYSILRAQKE